MISNGITGVLNRSKSKNTKNFKNLGFDPLNPPTLIQPYRALLTKGYVSRIELIYESMTTIIRCKITEKAKAYSNILQLDNFYDISLILEIFKEKVKVIKEVNKEIMEKPLNSLVTSDFDSKSVFDNRIQRILNKIGLIGRSSFKRPDKPVNLGEFLNTFNLEERVKLLTNKKNFQLVFDKIKTNEIYKSWITDFRFRDETKISPKNKETLNGETLEKSTKRV